MSFGPVDFQDWQRASNWDETTFTIAATTPLAGTYTSPIVPVSRWGYMTLFFSPTALQHQVQEWWYADGAGLIGVGGRQQNWDNATLNHLQLNLRHLGPYLQVIIVPSDNVTNWTPRLRVMLTNRVTPFISLLDGVTIDHSDAFTIAANGNRTFLNTYGGGSPIGCYVNGGSQGVNVEFQYLDSTYTYRRITKYAVAANVDDYRSVVWPLHSIQTIITNQSAGSACTGVQYTFVASVSGSS